MDYHYLIEAALLVAIVWLAARVRATGRDWEEALAREKKWRSDEYDSLNERHWDLQHETRCGFEALGLERTPSRPSIGPGWRVPEKDATQ